MEKDIFIARSANENTDAYKAFFDFFDAYDAAKSYYDHLTAAEKLLNRVTLEHWKIDAPADDARDANTIYTDHILSGGSLEPFRCDVLDDDYFPIPPAFYISDDEADD